jgi:PAS domain S-box-containing protein
VTTRVPLIGLGYLALYAAAAVGLRGYPSVLGGLGTLGLLLPAVAVCAIILRRRGEWIGCQRLFWDVFAVGMALWVIGHVGWSYGAVVEGRISWLQWHTVFTVCGGIAPLIALFTRPHRGPRPEAVGAVSLVLSSYGLLAVFIYAYFVLVPSLVLAERDAQQALLSVVLMNRLALVAAFVLAWRVGRRTPWRATYTYLALGVTLGLLFRTIASVAIARGDYVSGSLYDLAWAVPFACYACAAVVAPASRVTSGVDVPSVPMPAVVSAVPVFLIPLIGYGALSLQPLDAHGDAFRALVTGLMTVAGLGLMTLRLASQGDELQRTDARLRLIAAAMEQTGDLVLITRWTGEVELANPAFIKSLGYSRVQLTGMRFLDLLERGFETLGRHIENEVRTTGSWRGTLVRRRQDGTTFPAAATVTALRDSTGTITHFVGVERDITDELRLRDQLVHSERLSAIGELVAGVAHEINNPLQTIMGSVELLLDEQVEPSTRRDLEVVRREAGRAGQIVRNLLSFVRRSAPDRMSADLNQLVKATLDLRAFHLQQRDIRLVADLQPSALPVLVNREEIQQVVLNLLLNAEQAILSTASSGTITVRTYSTGRYHAVEVADDGPGVPHDLGGRVFEPFFTTKDVGQGTGLGLSISHGIASAHGGLLELCPSDRGACFRMTVPSQAASSPAVA